MQSEPTRLPVDADALCAAMEETFRGGGDFRFYPTGRSMLPMLRERGDYVILKSPAVRPPRVTDVVLYRRKNGQLVLHRIIGVRGDAFRMCGDGQSVPENGIENDQILGVLTAFCRAPKGNSHGAARPVPANVPLYRAYVRVWIASRPFRRLYSALRRRIFRLFRAKKRP